MKEILQRLFHHEELSSEETRRIMRDIAAGKYADEQIAALLAAFCMRSITVDELLGFRSALMDTRVAIDFSPYRPIDIVGTGDDGKDTFNISTCACFVVAGAGYKVAKHGNYAATSVSGASNVIEEHGVRFTADVDLLRRSMERCNVAYLHAQEQCVVVNAAFAIQVLEPEKEIAECIDLARESLESGRALEMFQRFIALNS